MQTDSETGLHPECTSAYDRFCLLKRESKDLSLDSPMLLNRGLETLICFSSHIPNLGIYSNIDPYSGSWVAAKFEFVKVLDLKSIVVGKSFLFKVESLHCLRYLAVSLSGWGSISMPLLAHLVHLNTFKVKSGPGLHLPFMIWNLQSLRHLHIARWNATSESFPVLERLVVAKCWRLEEVPPDFRDSSTLRAIEIDQCNRSVADSANRIQKYMEEELGIEDITVRILNSDLELGKWYL